MLIIYRDDGSNGDDIPQWDLGTIKIPQPKNNNSALETLHNGSSTHSQVCSFSQFPMSSLSGYHESLQLAISSLNHYLLDEYNSLHGSCALLEQSYFGMTTPDLLAHVCSMRSGSLQLPDEIHTIM